MNKLIPFFPRLAVKIGISILWGCLRFIEVILGVFTKWLKNKMNKPI